MSFHVQRRSGELRAAAESDRRLSQKAPRSRPCPLRHARDAAPSVTCTCLTALETHRTPLELKAELDATRGEGKVFHRPEVIVGPARAMTWRNPFALSEIAAGHATSRVRGEPRTFGRHMLRQLCVGCGLVVLAVMPMVALAQESKVMLREVVVTATRRETTIHETSISITALSGEEIQSRGTTDFDALARSVPGLAMKSSGPGQTEFEIRGLASLGGNSPVVGFYLDDIPLSAPSGAFNGRVVIDPNLYDLDRVEVLRGPQGTLYGSSSMGGAIKVITHAPDLQVFDASEQAILSDTDGGSFNYAENGMLNLPLGSNAALRIVGSESHESGWLDRIVIAAPDFPFESGPGFDARGNVLVAPVAEDYRGVNYEDLTGARATLLWRPAERLEITPMIFFQRIGQGGLNQIDSVPGADAHYQPFDFPEGFDDRIDLASLAIRYRFDGFDLTASTGRWKRAQKLIEDGNEEVQWALSAASGALLPFYISEGGFGNATPDFEQDYTDQWSEELRLTSTSHSPFQWLVGYFYSDFDSETNVTAIWPGAAAPPPGGFGTANAFTQHQPLKILQNSGFAEISYELVSHLKATAGIRRYALVSEITNSQSGALSATGSNAVLTTGNTERSQGASPEIGLTYEPSKELLLYTTAARGFRPGGGNQAIPTSGSLGTACEAALMAAYNTSTFVPSPSTFNPDSIWSYEIGEKGRASDHRLTINAAEYYERWNGVQQYVPLNCGFPFTANAGDAHIYGSELEIDTVLKLGLEVSLNASYTHGNFVTGSFDGLLVASGNQLQNIPRWTTSQSIIYHRPITQSLEFLARLDNSYIGSRIDVTYSVNHLPSYDLANVRLGASGMHWRVSLFLDNVLNRRGLIDNVLQYNLDAPTFNRTAVTQPLTIGVDCSYHFQP